MIFVDFLGQASVYQRVREPIQREVAVVFKTQPEDVVVRRVVTESEYPGLEVWIELSSEEQFLRHGGVLAERVTAAVKPVATEDVWVMFRTVPLDHAFLNGRPRGRGAAGFE